MKATRKQCELPKNVLPRMKGPAAALDDTGRVSLGHLACLSPELNRLDNGARRLAMASTAIIFWPAFQHRFSISTVQEDRHFAGSRFADGHGTT